MSDTPQGPDDPRDPDAASEGISIDEATADDIAE